MTDDVRRSWEGSLVAAVMTVVGVCAPAAAAQSVVAPPIGFGALRVTIDNQLGDPLLDVAITLIDETDGKTVATLTTTSPTFELAAVRPGTYGVRGTKPGFAFFYVSVDVRDLETTSREVVMKVADTREVVTVIGRDTTTDRALPPIRWNEVQDLPVRMCDAGGCVMPAMKVAGARPAYPATALANGVEGAVIIDATIDAEGRVREPAVLRPVDEALDAAALEVISQWRFTPAQLNGVAVPVAISITVDFRLTAPPAR